MIKKWINELIIKISNWNKIDKTKNKILWNTDVDRWKNTWIDNFDNKSKQTNKLKSNKLINQLKNDLNKYNK